MSTLINSNTNYNNAVYPYNKDEQHFFQNEVELAMEGLWEL